MLPGFSNEGLKEVNPEELNKFPRLCPDFIVELRSKGDSLKDLKAKMKEWMDNGMQTQLADRRR